MIGYMCLCICNDTCYVKEIIAQRIARPDFWVQDRDQDFNFGSLNNKTRLRLFFF